MTKMLQIMAIIYPCIVPAKVLKDGRHKIGIAVSHHSETKFITTDIILDNPSFLNNGVVTKCPNATYLNTRLSKPNATTIAAIEEARSGKAIHCGSFENYKKMVANLDDV